MAKDLKILITAKDKATRVMKRLGSTVKSITASVFSLRGAFALLAGAAGIGLVTRSLIRTSSEFENLRIQLNALQGSARAGGQALSWVKTFAKETPLSLEGVTSAFVRAKALGLDPMDGTMQALVDTSSKLGGGQERLMGIILAVGQAWTKGKLQAEEANQLIERGVPVWKLMGDIFGKNKDQVRKLAEEGKIGEIEIKKLIAAMGAESLGAAKANMKTMSGIMSNFGDQVSQAKDAFASAKGGLTDFVKSGLSLLTDELERLRGTGGIKRLGEDLGTSLINALRSGIEAIIEMLNWFDRLIGSVKLAIINFLEMNKAIAKVTDSIGFTSGEVEAFQKQINALEIDAGTFFLSAEERTKSIADVDIFFGKLEKRFEKFRAETAAQEALDASITDEQILNTPIGNGAQIRAEKKEAERKAQQQIFGHFILEEAQREHEERMFFIRTTAANKVREALKEHREREIQNDLKLNGIKLNNASGLFSLLSGVSKKGGKALFLISKAFQVAEAINAAKLASVLALANPPGPPSTIPLSKAVLTSGLITAASIAASAIGGGISGGGGGGISGGGGRTRSLTPGFSQIGQPQTSINLTINAIDSKSFLDNVDEVLEPIAEKLADHLGANGSSGQFNFVLERS